MPVRTRFICASALFFQALSKSVEVNSFKGANGVAPELRSHSAEPRSLSGSLSLVDPLGKKIARWGAY